MPIYRGANKLASVLLGSTAMGRAYRGATLVFDSAAGGGGSVPPVYVNQGAASLANAPSYPASVTADNYIELTIFNATGEMPNTPSGWAQLHSHIFVEEPELNAGPRCTTFWKVATGAESGSVAITFPGAGSGRSVAVITQFSGVETTGGPFEVLEVDTYQNSGSGINLFSMPLDLARQGSLVLNKYWTFSGVTGGMLAAPGTGWTEIFDMPNGGAGSDVTGSITARAFADPGVTTVENADDTVGIEYAVVSYALKSPDA